MAPSKSFGEGLILLLELRPTIVKKMNCRERFCQGCSHCNWNANGLGCESAMPEVVGST